MKNKLIVFILVLSVITSCKKKEIINLYEPRACFYAIKYSESFQASQYKDSGDAAAIDSNFYFRACYDTLDAYTYNWDFGDGTTSTERDPAHKYSKRGKYQVTLTVSNNSNISHTAQRNVWVALGDKYVTYDKAIDVAPIAMEETANNEFVLLGVSGNNTGVFLMRLDSLFKQTGLKVFPSGYYFRSMQPTTDGNYIVTGTTQGAGKTNELIKIKADGTVLWNKVIASDVMFNYAAQTADGGYAGIGVKTVNVPNVYNRTVDVTVVCKTDNNGNIQWQKVFDGEYLRNTRDAFVEQDGIVLAGILRNDNYYVCSSCDTLMLTKLDYAGNTVMKRNILWALNTSEFAGTHTTKLANGNYAVYNDTTQAVYFFAPNGQFVDRIFTGNRLLDLTNSADGKLFTMQTENSYIVAGKVGLEGKTQWLNSLSGRMINYNGISYNVFTQPGGIRRLRNGRLLVFGSGSILNTSGNYYHKEVFLVLLNENGKPM